jgi:hypothetical protein
MNGKNIERGEEKGRGNVRDKAKNREIKKDDRKITKW